MRENPFTLFEQFSDRVRVRLYGRNEALPDQTNIMGARQVHGNVTQIVREPSNERVDGADGLITNQVGIELSTRGADCQIFAVYDPVHHCGGVLHAGWRGLVAQAIPAFIQMLRTEFHSNPADLLVAAGPSLCLTCSEFSDPVRELTGIDPRFFQKRLADLRAIADDQWTSTGVQSSNIERHPDCTKCSRDQWWTLRGGDSDALKAGSHNALTFSLR